MSDFPPPSSALPVFVAVSEQAEHWANAKRLRGPRYPGGGAAGRLEQKPTAEGGSVLGARWLRAGLLHGPASLSVGKQGKQAGGWWPAGEAPRLHQVAIPVLF